MECCFFNIYLCILLHLKKKISQWFKVIFDLVLQWACAGIWRYKSHTLGNKLRKQVWLSLQTQNHSPVCFFNLFPFAGKKGGEKKSTSLPSYEERCVVLHFQIRILCLSSSVESRSQSQILAPLVALIKQCAWSPNFGWYRQHISWKEHRNGFFFI